MSIILDVSIAVKVCGLMREVDIDAAASADVDAVGLVLDPAPHQLSLGRAAELAAHARACGLQAVAVAGRVDEAELARVIECGAFDVVQVVADLSLRPRPELLAVFFDSVDLLQRVRAWQAAMPAPPRSNVPSHARDAAQRPLGRSLRGLINVDGPAGGAQGIRADWQRVAELARAVPLVLSGGLRVDNVAEALARVRPHAVDVCSGVERAPGQKDGPAMRAFVVAARAAAATIAGATARDAARR